MADHSLHLDGHPLYDWRLSCDHGTDTWGSAAEEGGPKESDDCWLLSWWDEHGVDLVSERAKWPKVTTLPIPVDVEGDGWDGPVLIPAKETTDE